jgi:hypothetical protein
MRIFGRIALVVVDGQERLLKIHPMGASDGQTLCVSALDFESWSEMGQSSERFNIGNVIDAQAELRLVIEVAMARSDSVLGMQQPIPNSPHTRVVARVVETSTKDSFECALGPGGPTLHVETEHAVSVKSGDVVALTGELALVDVGP